MTTLFISDLHLDGAAPDISAHFLEFLRVEAPGTDALYILGDLFEVWVGDDDPDPHKRRIEQAIRAVVDTGVPAFFLHGNRDFLLGDAFAERTGMTRLQDPTVTTIHGREVILMHGDTLCTDDVDYQAFRATVRDPGWQRGFLDLPLDRRRIMAGEARAASKASMAGKAAQIMDVNGAAVAATFRAHGVPLLLHGHTHRPGVHDLDVDGNACTRIVLGDWYDHGSVLRWDVEGPQLQTLPRR